MRLLFAAVVMVFLLQVGTGIALAKYYPTEPAHVDLRQLELDVGDSMLMQHVHARVSLLALAAAGAFFVGSIALHRGRGRVRISVGAAVLLLLTGFTRQTGYDLPWDQLSVRAVRVETTAGHNRPPFVASGTSAGGTVLERYDVRSFLPDELTANPLIRFHRIHVWILSVGMAAVLVIEGAMLWRFRDLNR